MFIDIYNKCSCKYMELITTYKKTVCKYLNWLAVQIPAFRAFCKTAVHCTNSKYTHSVPNVCTQLVSR